MTPTLLIDAIVRQTMILVATLATSSGQRTPLSHVATQVFGDLVHELKQQGIANRVIADMFGMALRTYQQRASRLSMSKTLQGESLWSSVLSFIRSSGPVLRAEVFERFEKDDEGVLRAVVRDLVESGLVEQSQKGTATRLCAVPAAENDRGGEPVISEDALVLVAVHEAGPVSKQRLRDLVPVEEQPLDRAIARLLDQGMVRQETFDGETVYLCDSCVIPFGAEGGWEAAVFDHYQALVTAVVSKVAQGQRRSHLSDHIGGSTFTFDIWEGHPLSHEVLGYLKSMREAGIALRKRVLVHNETHGRPSERKALRVVSYVGQNVREEGNALDD